MREYSQLIVTIVAIAATSDVIASNKCTVKLQYIQ